MSDLTRNADGEKKGVAMNRAQMHQEIYASRIGYDKREISPEHRLDLKSVMEASEWPARIAAQVLLATMASFPYQIIQEMPHQARIEGCKSGTGASSERHFHWIAQLKGTP